MAIIHFLRVQVSEEKKYQKGHINASKYLLPSAECNLSQ